SSRHYLNLHSFPTRRSSDLEAGFDVFQQALKTDALNSGLTFMADSGNRYMQGEGQHITYNFAFDSMVTRETGRVELIHLKELDRSEEHTSELQSRENLVCRL